MDLTALIRNRITKYYISIPYQNHPPQIIKQLPTLINKRLSENLRVITARNKKLLSENISTVLRCNAEWRTNAHCMENAGQELFYTNALPQLVWNQAKFFWKQLNEVLNNMHAIVARMRLPFFEILANIAYFCKNLQIFCPVFPFLAHFLKIRTNTFSF